MPLGAADGGSGTIFCTGLGAVAMSGGMGLWAGGATTGAGAMGLGDGAPPAAGLAAGLGTAGGRAGLPSPGSLAVRIWRREVMGFRLQRGLFSISKDQSSSVSSSASTLPRFRLPFGSGDISSSLPARNITFH